MRVPPLQWRCVPCSAPFRRFAYKRFHTGSPLPVQLDELQLGGQPARETASPADAGTVVNRTAGETVPAGGAAPLP
jgi:hypothetical protein